MWEGEWNVFLGYHSIHTSVCSPSWKLFDPHTFGVFMEASPLRHDWSLTPFPALLSSLHNWGLGWKSQSSNMAWPFWRPAPFQKPTKSCLTRTKDAPITQEITGPSGALCQELRGRPIYILHYLLLWIFNGLSTTCWKDCSFFTELLWHPLSNINCLQMWGLIFRLSALFHWPVFWKVLLSKLRIFGQWRTPRIKLIKSWQNGRKLYMMLETDQRISTYNR